MKKTKCEKCGKEISNNNYKKHVQSCKNKTENNKIKIQDEWLQPNGKYKCPYCGKEYKKLGIKGHIWRYHTEEGKNFDPNRGYKNGSRKAWNKGLTKEIDERVKKYGESISNTFKQNLHPWLGKKHKKETIEKLSLAAVLNHKGGYKHVPYIKYTLKNGKEIELRGSYELRFAKWLDKNNIDWEYQKSISYIDKEGIKRYFAPDFYLTSINEFIDTKGTLFEEFREKMNFVKEQKGITIHLLFEDKLKALEKGEINLEDIIKKN